MSEQFDTVVLGGGIAGLVAAYLARRSSAPNGVLLVEGSQRLGGSMAGCRSMGEEFDLGTHIPQETGIAVIDELFERAIGDDRLQRMPSAHGDRAGTIVNGRIFSDTQYPDLLGQDPDLAKGVLAHVTSDVSDAVSGSVDSIRRLPVERVATSWFGVDVTTHLILPMLRRWFGDTETLSGFALELANLTRLRVVDESTWLEHASSERFRQRIAYPNQSNLPHQFQHGRRSLYPRSGTSASFVEGLEGMCKQSGVRIQTKTRISRLDLHARRIELIEGEERRIVRFRRLISTLGPITSLQLIGGSPQSEIRRVTSQIVHHVADRPIESDLCYLYVSSEHSPVFRITNYRGFSGRVDDCRLTTEILSPSTIDGDQAIVEAESILRDSDLLGSDNQLRSAVVPIVGGFPSPELTTFEHFHLASTLIARDESDEFIVSGTGAAGEVFFQNEILKHLFSRLF